jgi:hypothetical protein
MVRRQSRVKSTGPRRRTVQPAPRRAPTAPAVHPVTVAEMKTRLDVAGHRLQVVGLAASRFARSSMREVTGAVKASREPMTALWRNVRLASRHIARDAAAAWNEVVPAGRAVLKLPVMRGARRPAA